MKAWIAVLGTAATLGVAPLAAQEAPAGPAVIVQNDFSDPVTVFLDRGIFDRRLGVVDGLTTRTLSIPPSLVDDGGGVRLFVVRKGGEELESHDFQVERGHTLGLIVPTPKWEPAEEYAVLPADERSETTLSVVNDRADDAVVYADEGGPVEVRLGIARAHDTTTFVLPRSAIQDDRSVRVLVEPHHGFDLESYPLEIRNGEHLGLRLTARG